MRNHIYSERLLGRYGFIWFKGELEKWDALADFDLQEKEHDTKNKNKNAPCLQSFVNKGHFAQMRPLKQRVGYALLSYY